MSANTQVTFEMDATTEKAIEDLKTFFNVKTRSAAIRRAIALAGVIAPTAKDQVVVVRDQKSPDNKDLTILVGR
jgi:hypothetical protein